MDNKIQEKILSMVTSGIEVDLKVFSPDRAQNALYVDVNDDQMLNRNLYFTVARMVFVAWRYKL